MTRRGAGDADGNVASSGDRGEAEPSAGEGVRGSVRSSAGGRPVPGAAVEAGSIDGGPAPLLAAVTLADGTYAWALAPGRYRVRFSATGFEVVVKWVTVELGSWVELDVELPPEAP